MDLSFGPILKKHRESQGLSVRQVSIAIKITPSMIEDIEKENFAALPQSVFLRGLIRTYCKQLNINENEILDIFDHTTKYEKMSARRSHIEDTPGQIRTPNYVWLSRIVIPIFVIASLAIAAVVIVLITQKYDKEIRTVMNPNVSEIHKANETQTSGTPVTAVESETPAVPADAKLQADVPLQSAGASADSKILTPNKITQVITLEPLAKTLVYVKVDDSENQKIILRPDVNRTFQALNKIKLTIQDGGAVNIIHNNKDIGVPGVFGQEIELTFPND